MKIELTLPHEYELETSAELPSGPTSNVWYYPGASTLGGKNGILLKVIPREADSWYGLFACFEASYADSDGVFSCPNRQQLCVVSGGEAYIVNVRNPSDWCTVRCCPVTHVRVSIEDNLLLFVDFTRITAWGISGEQWTTDDLALDGVTITEVRDGAVFGTGEWVCYKDPIIEFAIDLSTGQPDNKLLVKKNTQ